MKPTEAQLRIGDSAPITVKVDKLTLVERPFPGGAVAGPLPARAEVTLQFDVTPAFAAWWEAASAAVARVEAAPEQPHAYVFTACQHTFHLDCEQTCEFCETECRCWCHSTCSHVIPYLVSDNCQSCGRTPEEMGPDPQAMRTANAEARRLAAVKDRLRLQYGGEQR